MAQAQQISPQQRAALFTQATRQNYQTLGTRSASSELEQIVFDLPKARLLSKITLIVEAVANLKSSNSAIPVAASQGFGVLRKVQLDLNNGFSPYSLTGDALFGISLARLNPDVSMRQTASKRAVNYIENAASVGGVDNTIRFSVELPVTLNDRDPVGLLMLQNQETNVQLKIDVDQLVKAYKPAAGDTVTFKSFKVTPVLETFTIPSIKEAFPDVSVMKLVSDRQETLQGQGVSTIKLNTGTIYRKLFFYLEDANGAPLTDEDIVGNFELVFNQADVPYNIPAKFLAHLNHRQYGMPLPDGWYAFDFTIQGLPNYGGSRDYIDTERLTEFWLRVNTTKAGKVRIVSENLSRLV